MESSIAADEVAGEIFSGSPQVVEATG